MLSAAQATLKLLESLHIQYGHFIFLINKLHCIIFPAVFYTIRFDQILTSYICVVGDPEAFYQYPQPE